MFLDIKVGDTVLCLDEYLGGSSYHTLVIDSIEDDEEYATATNPLDRRYFGTDQDYVNEDGEFEAGDYKYLTVVDESNFVLIKNRGVGYGISKSRCNVQIISCESSI